MANGKTAITFHRAMSPYMAGDVAAFPADKAKEYVDRGVAGYFNRQMVSDRPVVGAAGAGSAPVKATTTTNPKSPKKGGKKKRVVIASKDDID